MLPNTQFQTVPLARMLPHQTQIKICPCISLGINSHSQIALAKLERKTHPSRPGHMRNAFLSCQEGHLSAPKDLGPASSNLPCVFKSMAKLFTERSVSGCWAPSWDSRPSNARRWRPSAWRLEMEC